MILGDLFTASEGLGIPTFVDPSRLELDPHAVLRNTIDATRDALFSFSQRSSWLSQLQQAIGDEFDTNRAESLLSELVSGQQWPDIQVIPFTVLQGKGAFGEGQIYLADELLNPQRSQDAIRTLTEELGHYLDWQLNREDALGDEGEIFANLVLGELITDAELQALQAQNDHGTLTWNDRTISVEYAEGDPGTFTVGNAGQITFDFLADAGAYRGDLAFFSLTGLEALDRSSNDFVQAALNRAVSVISDSTDGSQFQGELGEQDWNSGTYQGQRTFTATPGEEIALLLVPNGTLQQVLANASLNGNLRPLFSIPETNPDRARHLGQLVANSVNGGTFGWEDLRTDQGSDFDYNDLIFQLQGADGEAPLLETLVSSDRPWLTTPFGQALQNYALENDQFESSEPPSLTVSLASDTGTSNSDGITQDPVLVGTVISTNSLATLQLSLDGVIFQDITADLDETGSFSLSATRLAELNGGALPDGEYSFSLLATDELGLESDRFGFAFTLDTTSPNVPTDLSLASGTTITADTTPTLTGVAEAGSRVALFQGDTLLGETIATETWTIIPVVALAEGLQSIRARVTDVAGNVSEYSPEFEFTVDSQAPLLTINSPVENAQLTPGARLTGTVDATGSALNRLVYRFNDRSEIEVPVGETGAFDVPLDLTGLGDGAQVLSVIAIDGAGNRSEQNLTVQVLAETTNPPLITTTLENDTGSSNSDGITNDATISGTVLDSSPIAQFQARLGDGEFVDVLDTLQNGVFTLTEATLQTLNGAQPLIDGTYNLGLQATDTLANASSEVRFNFTLDRLAPQAPGFALDSLFDSAPIGESSTTFATVRLLGQTEANATLTLNNSGDSLSANAQGQFQFSGVDLVLGDNLFTITATDLAGNTSSFSETIARVAQDDSDVVLDWNAILLNAIHTDKTAPPIATRNMAIVQTAVFDALNSLAPSYENYAFTGVAPTGASAEAAVAGAAYRALVNLYPNQQDYFDTALAASLAEIPDGTAEDLGVAFGQSVADAILALRSEDGSTDTVTYTPGTDPGDWQPTAPAFASALLPQWGQVTPWALTSGDQFRPDGVPALDSADYATEFNQVKDLGSLTSTTRTADQTEIAQFWADGSGTFTPPGHWNQIAQNIVVTTDNSLLENARLFALLDIGLADAGIAAWDAKYTYNFWRPITAIQNADTDGNADTIADATWTPLLTTPPFPEYVSGHSTFSGAADAILSSLLGSDVAFSTNSLGTPGVYRDFDSFTEAANEAGISRIYGGIHFNSANVEGLELGRNVGDFVLDNLLVALPDLIPPIASLASTPSTTSTFVELSFSEAVTDGAFVAENYTLTIASGANAGQTVTIASVEKISTTQVRLNLATPFILGTYQVTIAAGITDLAGNATLSDQVLALTVNTAPLSITPTNGEELVTLTRDTVVRFGKEVDPASVTAENFYLIANGDRIAGTIRVSSTEEFATFIYDAPLPASTEVRVVVDGSSIIGRDGVAIDGDQDGTPGGIATADFTTLPLTQIPGTDVWGYVYDSYNRNPDGSNIPIVGATIRLDALPDVFAVTDENGYFILEDVPAPDFYVYIDGSTAIGAPAATQYASLGKPFHSVPGQSTQLFMDGVPFNVYLPPMAASDVKPLSTTEETQVGFGEVSQEFLEQLFPDVDPDVWSQVQVTFNPGSAQDDAGNAATQAMIIPVDPNRLPAPLPPGADPKLVISIQAGGANGFNREADGGATNFDVPAPIQFPNLEGLKPGEKSLFWSFDHDAGKWIVIGTGTVSEDGKTIKSDPGVGVLAPGWHFTNPGTPTNGPTKPDKPDDCDPDVFTIENAIDLFEQVTKCAAGFFKIQGLIAKVFEIASEAKSLIGSADKLLKGLEDGSLNASDVQALFQSINSSKKILKSAFDGIKDQNPLGKALAISKCLENLLSFSASVCGKITEQDSGCNTIAVRTVCNGLDLARSTLGKVNSLIEKAEEGLKEVLFALACGTIDQIASLLGFAAQSQTRIIETNSFKVQADIFNVQAESDNLSPETVEEMKSLLSKLIGEMEGFLVNAEAGSEMGKILEDVGEQVEILEPSVNQMSGELLDYPDNAYYLIEYGDFELRGRTNSQGQFETVLAPNTEFNLSIYDSTTGRIARYSGETASSGSTFQIPVLAYVTTKGIADIYEQEGLQLPQDLINELSDADLYGISDSDNDGLVDEAEKIIGTTANKKDTDNDGINDFAEIQQGLDPLGGQGFPTGIISSLPLQGEAKGIVVAGSTTNSETQTAYVATGDYGLAVVNASQFNNPIILGQLNLPGDATDVAVDTRLNIAAVATNSGGLHLVNVADRMLPTLNTTININANQVEIADGIAYATVDNILHAIDLVTGEELQRLTLPDSGTVTGLAREGNTLYALAYNSGATFSIIDITNEGAANILGQLSDVPISDITRVFAANGIVYLGGAGGGIPNGLTTIDVSNPTSPTLISPPDFNFDARGLALNGSGLALIGSEIEGQGIGIYDISNPENTNAFLTQISTPGISYDIAIASGIAYVANGSSGLQVINYLPFDNKGIPPTVSISSSIIDADPNLPDIQVIEGRSIPINIQVSDDVQVRNVELLVNGNVVTNDVSAPFDLLATMPTLASGATSANIQVRATDTGGNSTLSNILTYELIKDNAPPVVIRTSPGTQRIGVNNSPINIWFNEALDPSRLNLSGLTLMDLGVDGVIGGGDDQVVKLASVQLTEPQRLVILPETGLKPGEYQRREYQLTINPDIIADIAGNNLVSPFNLQFTNLNVPTDSVAWISKVDGNWNSPNNWSTGSVPTNGAKVIIDIPNANPLITLSNSVTLSSIHSEEPFLFTDGGFFYRSNTLTLTGSSVFNGGLTTTTSSIAFGGNANITVNGLNASLAINGLTNLSFSDITASNGAKITLSDYSANNTTFRATGTGSLIDFSSLTNFGDNSAVNIQAVSGGNVNLKNINQISTEPVQFLSEGTDSTIDLSSLTNFTKTGGSLSSITVRNGGTIEASKLTNLDGVSLSIDQTGTISTKQIKTFINGGIATINGTTPDFSGLTDITGAGFIAANGGVVSLPVTSYTGNSAEFFTTLRAEGAGSLLDLSNVTTLSGATFVSDSLNIEAVNGGQVNLRNTTQITGGLTGIISDGVGSFVNLSSLTNFTKTGSGSSSITSRNGGTVEASKLTSLTDVNLTSDNSILALLALIAYNGDNQTQSLNGGTLDLRNLKDIPTGKLQVLANGTNSIVDISSLIATDASLQIEELNGGIVRKA